MQFERLFTPIRIRNKTARNRIVFPCHATRFIQLNKLGIKMKLGVGIGDCYSPRRALGAIHEGFNTSVKI